MISWRLVLPLIPALIALANAGGRTLSPQDSAQFLQLFRRYCSSPSASPTQEGNTFYYCKTADGPITQTLNHDSEIQAGETPKQVIFVQPPSYQYTHNVALRGSPGNPQETDIYVLPQTADHNLQLQDTRTAVQAVKPSLYFLNDQQQNNGGGNNNIGLPTPIVGAGASIGLSTGQRPSSPLPRPSSPNAIGINSNSNNGFSSQPQQQQQQQQGGYSQAYGAPASLNPRSQRNLRGSHFSSSSSNNRYSSL